LRRLINSFKSLYYLIRDATLDFIENQDTLKAAALSFYTLTSIVPFLAIMFGAANGLGIEDFLQRQLREAFVGQEEFIEYVIKFARSMLQNTRGSVIAGIGFIILLWTAFSILSNVESSLNDILKIKEARSWPRRIIDYSVLMIVLPIVFLATSGLNVYLATQIYATSEEFYLIKIVSPYLLFSINIVPFILSILLFTIVYVFVPTYWITLSSRITAGIITGIIFQFWQIAYIRFQGEISNYGAIYGTFAALPLFLVWLQASWLILLAGAEIAAYLENKVHYPVDSKQLSDASPQLAGLAVLYLCVKAYNNAEQPPSLLQISQLLGVSPQIIRQLLNILQHDAILIAVKDPDSGQIGYLPGKDVMHLKIKDIADEIEEKTTWTTSIILNPVVELISAHLEKFKHIIANSEDNISIAELIKHDLSHRDEHQIE